MKTDEYRKTLEKLAVWDDYLRENSGLPGPRGNLELAVAVVDLADEKRIQYLLSLDGPQVEENTAQVFLVFCGVQGLGKLVAEGQREYLPVLRGFASDARWRVRESVAFALQRCGKVDMARLVDEMRRWVEGNSLEQRAAAAALCEPVLLKEAVHARGVLMILDRITASILSQADRRSEEFRVLRKGLAYCWSVAVAALPVEGKPLMEKWIACPDEDIRWIMRENLKKNRLSRMDAEWVKKVGQV
jgi:hypothetical protein